MKWVARMHLMPIKGTLRWITLTHRNVRAGRGALFPTASHQWSSTTVPMITDLMARERRFRCHTSCWQESTVAALLLLSLNWAVYTRGQYTCHLMSPHTPPLRPAAQLRALSDTGCEAASSLVCDHRARDATLFAHARVEWASTSE